MQRCCGNFQLEIHENVWIFQRIKESDCMMRNDKWVKKAMHCNPLDFWFSRIKNRILNRGLTFSDSCSTVFVFLQSLKQPFWEKTFIQITMFRIVLRWCRNGISSATQSAEKSVLPLPSKLLVVFAQIIIFPILMKSGCAAASKTRSVLVPIHPPSWPEWVRESHSGSRTLHEMPIRKYCVVFFISR